jgi:hypothetical protein
VAGIDGAPVHLLRLGDVAAVVGTADAATYEEARLNERLRDLRWVGERGVRHEAVLNRLADAGPVVPLKLFSLHRDVEAVATRVRGDAARLRGVLERLRGRREWGVRLARSDAGDAVLAGASPALAALDAQIAAAAPGTAYLLRRKRESAAEEALRGAAAALAHDAFERLAAAAEDAVAVPLAAPAAGKPARLALDAYFLVAEAHAEGFRGAVGRVAADAAARGLEAQFTGPWPFYHFAGGPDGG